jgi:hypothetical protein
MLLARAVDRGTTRRRAGSELRVFCQRGHRGILSLVWIRGMFAPFLEFDQALDVSGERGLGGNLVAN